MDKPHVTGADPSIFRECFRRKLGVIQVPLEDDGSPYKNLSIFGNPQFRVRQWLAYGSEAIVVLEIDRGEATHFGLSPGLENEHSGGVEELDDLEGDGRGRREEESNPSPEDVPYSAKYETVGDRPLQPEV